MLVSKLIPGNHWEGKWPQLPWTLRICLQEWRKPVHPLKFAAGILFARKRRGSRNNCWLDRPPQSDMKKIRQGVESYGGTGRGSRCWVDGQEGPTEEAAEAEVYIPGCARQGANSAVGNEWGVSQSLPGCCAEVVGSKTGSL